VGSTSLSPFEGSIGAMNLYSPDSNVIFIVFKLNIEWLSNSQSIPSNVGYVVVPSTISITLNYAIVHTPSKSIVIRLSLPIGIPLC
jgi:hypothetical protein